MTPHAARLDATPDTDRAHDRSLEWLETDGVGGFASGTVDGRPTRRYHGLLIAIPPGLLRRHLFLAGYGERWTEPSGVRFDLETRTRRTADGRVEPIPGAVNFDRDPAPTTTFDLDGTLCSREVLMPKGRSVVITRHAIAAGGAPLELELEPRLACREVDRLHFRNEVLDSRHEFLEGVLRVRPYQALPELVFRIDAGVAEVRFESAPRWITGIEYSVELERGYDGHEDLFVPGTFHVVLHPGQAVTIAVSLDQPVEDPCALRSGVLDVRRKARLLRRSATSDSAVRARLDLRADDFLQVRGGRLGICAGYPWFGEWGRDTCIALPGLTLARGRVDQCARILGGILPFVRDGLVPNIFGNEVEDSHYGSVDAALWFARAIDLWRAAGGRRESLDRALDAALLDIASSYHDGRGLAGTELKIHVDDDGLLICGDRSLNATWMDARLPSGPVTPRDGKPVEIAALWCSLLDQVVAIRAEDPVWRARRDKAHASFIAAFWIARPADGSLPRLADRLDEAGQPDPRVRPNMVLAAALPRSPLSIEQRRCVLECCESALLTPRGLRTLTPEDPEYQPRYHGDVISRDRAYHQGTAWPWLLGAHVELALRVRGRDAVPELRRLLDDFADELDRAGLDHVSEVFDGDPPHAPGGTIAQAWNTGELLRAYAMLEDVP